MENLPPPDNYTLRHSRSGPAILKGFWQKHLHFHHHNKVLIGTVETEIKATLFENFLTSLKFAVYNA